MLLFRSLIERSTLLALASLLVVGAVACHESSGGGQTDAGDTESADDNETLAEGDLATDSTSPPWRSIRGSRYR